MSDLVIPPGYGRVVGRVLRAVTVETGPAPLVGARVTVRPSVARVTRDGDPAPLIVGDAIACTLDDNGFLLGPDGEQGVLLVATDADTRPTGWHWVVKVSAPSVASYQWQVLVPEGVTTDMVAATSDPAVSGLPLLEWRGILADVWEAHADVMSAAGAVDHDRQLAMAARAGAEQAADRAETARDQAVTARGAAEAAADTAETARNQAVTAKNLAEGFAGDAETALTSTLAAAVYELRGTGQPGSTTETANAPVGTYYTDTAGTAGAWRWLKTTAGSGVSRWTVVYGDTGWRNVLSLLPPEYWAGKPDDPFLRIKRDGNRVTIAGRIIAAKQISSYSRIIDFPAGFRPYNRFVNLGVGTSTSTLVPLGNQYWSTFLTTPTVLPPGDFLMFEISFHTNDTFPTTLPGTPA